ncbi:GNAT superfamily N-acetyltransferase [Alkalihalobacillus xiaoxiensis]|uniref:GNAT superfamily N-acetyltransferase n=1 Tax=Shouchella xiaoxiensis TaxID=766895 RepID=A0ABS2SWD8_9BACI|nr:GNAT family N-acetyltransferase [Shouchella xiaoxiensis]MBM7839841.1 GNAT superfamily N-acetyltransferase [Shouchella xiaoxiensis]
MRREYRDSLKHFITYVAYDGNKLYGFSRSILDGAFHVHVCDLLVHKNERGKGLEKRLPYHTVLVMSDVDDYYQKVGYEKSVWFLK